MPNPKNDWIDISLTIETGRIVWPGDPGVEVSKLLQIENGDICNTSLLTCPVHVGTHVDAPLHFVDGGDGIESLPLYSLAGKAKVFEIKNETEIPLGEFENSDIGEGDIVLFKTINSTVYLKEKSFNEKYVYLSTEAAEYLVMKKIATVGIDYYSIAGINNKMTDKANHKCTVCGKPSPMTICETCKAHIQAEAVGEKKKSEKGIKIGGDVLADKAAGHKTGK